MKKLGFVGLAAAALAVSGCRGGASSPASTAAVATASPGPGTLSVAYTDNFGVTGTAPTALGFLAPTETATLTATQSNYTGSYAATSSCAQVTVTPATSTTGSFTATAVSPATSGCTITVTGATGTTAATLAATVPTPAGVVMRWYAAGYQGQQVPVPQSAGPINLVGLGAIFASVLQISEANYVGGFAATNVVTSAGCTGFATAAASAPSGLPTAAPGTSQVYYTVTGVNTILTTGGCTVTATDSYVPVAPATPNPSVSIGVEITTLTGTFQ